MSETRPDLLDARMTSLGLSAASVGESQPALMQTLQRACSSCALKSRCARDLASTKRASSVAAYCPNEPTLKSLRSRSSD